MEGHVSSLLLSYWVTTAPWLKARQIYYLLVLEVKHVRRHNRALFPLDALETTVHSAFQLLESWAVTATSAPFVTFPSDSDTLLLSSYLSIYHIYIIYLSLVLTIECQGLHTETHSHLFLFYFIFYFLFLRQGLSKVQLFRLGMDLWFSCFGPSKCWNARHQHTQLSLSLRRTLMIIQGHQSHLG